MCAKFGCGPTVVSKKGGGTDRQRDRQTDTAALYSRCQGDKFTNITGCHQVEQLRHPALEPHQPLDDCIRNRAAYQNPE